MAGRAERFPANRGRLPCWRHSTDAGPTRAYHLCTIRLSQRSNPDAQNIRKNYDFLDNEYRIQPIKAPLIYDGESGSTER
jgi:hypothetical protein